MTLSVGAIGALFAGILVLVGGIVKLFLDRRSVAPVARDDEEKLDTLFDRVEDLHKWHNHPLPGYDGEVMNWWITQDIRRALANMQESISAMVGVLEDQSAAISELQAEIQEIREK